MSAQLGASAADRYAQAGAPCLCGHPFGSGACLNEHARRAAALTPLRVARHEHRWLRPVRGVMHCAAVTCNVTARVEGEGW